MGKNKPEPIEATYNSACDDGQRRILFRVSGGFIGELVTDDMKSAIKIIRACNDHDRLKSQKAALLAACKVFLDNAQSHGDDSREWSETAWFEKDIREFKSAIKAGESGK